jgi:hypothetical protein
MASDDLAIMPVRGGGCFQKIVDGHGWQTVVLSMSLESENIFFLNLYLCRVLDSHNTFVVSGHASLAYWIFKVW